MIKSIKVNKLKIKELVLIISERKYLLSKVFFSKKKIVLF